MVAINISASPLGILLAFLGGMVSILSPCVLPILPGFLGIVSGMTIDELRNDSALGRKVLKLCVLFSLGFSFVYVVIGLATTQLSQSFLNNSSLATRVGGFILLFFAFLLLLNHLTHFRWIQSETRPFLRQASSAGALLAGAAFAFGWSPCIGPILGGVLAYVSTEHALAARIVLILSYCLGLCVAMTLIVYGSFRYQRLTHWLRRHTGVFIWCTFVVMVFFGVILAMNQMSWVTAQITKALDALGLDRLVTIG
jgi:cytochrome c-type biogenesis protein